MQASGHRFDPDILHKMITKELVQRIDDCLSHNYECGEHRLPYWSYKEIWDALPDIIPEWDEIDIEYYDFCEIARNWKSTIFYIDGLDDLEDDPESIEIIENLLNRFFRD